MIYILFGEDEARSRFKLETIKKKNSYETIERFNMETDSLQEILTALDTSSIFSDTEMIVVENCAFLDRSAKSKAGKGEKKTESKTSRKKSGEDPVAKLIQEFSRRDYPDKILVLLCTCKTLSAAVKKAFSNAVIMESIPLSEQNIQGIVQEMMDEKNMNLPRDAFEWFCEHAGLNSMTISSELDKIHLFSSNPTLEDVKALTTTVKDENVFAMSDALFRKDSLKLIGLYRDFRKSGMEPLAVLGLLASQIRFAFRVRALSESGMPQDQIAQSLNVRSGRIYYTLKNVRNFSAEALLEQLSLLSELDFQIKSGQIDKDSGFEDFFLHLGKRKLF